MVVPSIIAPADRVFPSVRSVPDVDQRALQVDRTSLTSPDIRVGMPLLDTALWAAGKSTMQNANMMERGYGRIEEKLPGLGARITRRD